MLDAAREIMDFTLEKQREAFDHDRKLTLTLIKEVEIIGEAAYQKSKETGRLEQDIRFPQIITQAGRLMVKWVPLPSSLSTLISPP
ncbi:MAG: DUF86 domain-containing protein [Desulfobacterota bacterium]|nr:DUF86 domain-containing protein [Thermodesulfobacteriota bacterium]